MNKEIIYTAIFLTIFFFVGCNHADFISLYNGYDLTGWEVKAKPEDLNRNFWKAANGYIEANSLGQPDHDYIWLPQ